MSQGLYWRSSRLSLLLVLLLLIAACVHFARVQNVWIDESTQLSGMTLGPLRLIGWLAGAPVHEFAVPPDRMPPVSYLIDASFYRLWGANVLAFRALHLAITAAGAGVLLCAISKRMGLQAMIVAGLVLALSPKLVETAVEIRAYPLFFALTCLQLAMALRAREQWSWRAVAVFAGLALASGYTHFFGVVAGSAIMVATIVTRPDRKSAIRLAQAYAVLLVLWIGLAPFVTGASSISSVTESASLNGLALITWVLKLIGHSANLLSPIGAFFYFVGAFGLAAIAKIAWLMRARGGGLAERVHPIALLLAALGAGLVVTVLAAFVIKGFNPLKPSYSIWALPLIAALIGSCFMPRIFPDNALFRFARASLLGVFLIGALWGQVEFLAHARWFVHGPERALQAALDKAPSGAAIVYAGDDWGYGYFPLAWRSENRLDQWLISSDGARVRHIGRGGNAATPEQPLTALNRYPALVIAQIVPLGYRELRAAPPGERSAASPIAVAERLRAGWSVDSANAYPGLYWLVVETAQRQKIR